VPALLAILIYRSGPDLTLEVKKIMGGIASGGVARGIIAGFIFVPDLVAGLVFGFNKAISRIFRV
jgi:hypothetical protein